ncbi:hypothetical protein ACN20G_05765 [Streptomyces sp. BI20]|uniref:hypothetical protein n=1 Tax=Streptomyces sp. BI20 TaxID=3403460 RepID=UPI003C75AEFB
MFEYEIATARHDELLREAEEFRLVRAARAGHTGLIGRLLGRRAADGTRPEDRDRFTKAA